MIMQFFSFYYKPRFMNTYPKLISSTQTTFESAFIALCSILKFLTKKTNLFIGFSSVFNKMGTSPF